MKTKKAIGCLGKSIPWLLALIMLLTLAAIPASADDGSVTTCIPAAADAYVLSNQTNVNYGTSEVLRVDNQTGQVEYTFLKFDLSGIPAGSTITAASLELYMEQAPSKVGNPNEGTRLDRTYNLYGANDTLSDGTTPWTDSNIKYINMPAVQSTEDASVATGTTDGTLKTWTSASLLSRVQTEFSGDKTVSFEIRDSVQVAGTGASEAIFTSKETTTQNAQPCLRVTYEPPVTPSACIDDNPLLIEAFNHSAGTVQLGTYECFNIEFQITACEDLDKVKVQGGIGGNLIVKNIVGTINGQPAPQPPTSKTPGGSSNTLITWNIDHLNANDVASLTAEVCTGLNPQGKQEFTSCGINPITGNWSASAVLSSNNRIKIKSYPEYTDRLVVDVECPTEPTSP